MKLNYTSMFGQPFCDYLNVTLPTSSKDELLYHLNGLIDSSGISTFDSGLTYGIDGHPGTLKVKTNSRYITLSASGGMLQHFRNLRLFDSYLEIISKFEHKVTSMDATADFFVTYAPDVIQSVKRGAMASEIALTQKQLPSTNCKWLLSPNANGDETGTVYLGKRASHSVQAKVYDKGQERIDKGYAYSGQVVRIELSLKSDTGISLRDAHNPENVFYHYAHRSLVIPPPHFIGWNPLHSGFTIPAQVELFEPAGKILNIFKFSPDVGRAIKIALTAFPTETLDVLIAQFRLAFLSRQSSTTV